MRIYKNKILQSDVVYKPIYILPSLIRKNGYYTNNLICKFLVLENSGVTNIRLWTANANVDDFDAGTSINPSTLIVGETYNLTVGKIVFNGNLKLLGYETPCIPIGYYDTKFEPVLNNLCFTNLVFQSNEIQGNFLLDKDRVRANDALFLSKCVYLNGTTAKITKTFTNDILYYLDKITIVYSTNGTTRSTWVTGNAAITGLVQIDLANRTISIGFDGTNYKAMWVSHIIMEYNNGVELIPWSEFTLSSGDETKDYNRTLNEGEWVDRLFPFNIVKNIKIQNLTL
jgi:hypothetical protein